MIDDDPEALHCLLEILYTKTYAFTGSVVGSLHHTDAEWIELVKRHAEIFSLADKYDIKKLKQLARTRLAIAHDGSYARLLRKYLR